MSSLWIDSTKDKGNFSQLKEDISTDICIIGAGLFGLSTGYYLTKAGKKVTILEREPGIGIKTSGNTTGKITSQHGLFYDHLIKDFDEKFAKKYLNANEQAISNIKDIIDSNNIDCDFEWQDNYVYTTKLDEVPQIESEVSAVNKLGFKAEFLSKTSLPFKVSAAIKFPNQAQFNCSKYMMGLSSYITNSGNSIYTNTNVNDIAKDSKSNGYIIVTPSANVKANKVVIATHYPILSAPGFYFTKMYQSTSYGIAVDTHSKLFDGMYINVTPPIFSFRTADYNGKKILVVVGSDHKTGEAIENDSHYAELEKEVFKLYPSSEVLFRWNTEDCISLDKIPYIGEFSNIMPHVYVGTGFKKWGITSSNLAANIITDKILGKSNKFADIFNSKRFDFIKNRWEVKNMVKQTANSLVFEKFRVPHEAISNIAYDNGAIINLNGVNVGIYKDTNGNIFALKPNCSHLGCLLTWNNLDKTWDCPCHGSRFDYMGHNIYNPANKSLKIIDLNDLS